MEQRLSARDNVIRPHAESDEEEAYSPAMYLPATNADPAIEVEREEWEEDSSDRLTIAMAKLDERSRSILKRRWMTDDKATLHELADEYGISAERVRQGREQCHQQAERVDGTGVTRRPSMRGASADAPGSFVSHCLPKHLRM